LTDVSHTLFPLHEPQATPWLVPQLMFEQAGTHFLMLRSHHSRGPQSMVPSQALHESSSRQSGFAGSSGFLPVQSVQSVPALQTTGSSHLPLPAK
jgi:hypothetical protein